jgi:nicotinate-nucleotide adenylyltransferase
VGRVIWLLSLFLFLASLHVFGHEPVDCSFLLNQIAKNSREESKAISNLSNLDALNPPNFDFLHKRVFENQSKEERFKAISELLLDQVIAAPGHRFLRKPQQVEGLAKYIRENNGGNFQHDRILINVVTREDGKIREVDLWNAHHRFLAYRLAGYDRMGQLNLDNIDILVNGIQSWGENWGHYLPSAGIDLTKFREYRVVPVGGDIREGTLSLSGRLTNYELGSRNTIGQLMINTMREYKPKVGVYFGTFDPIHEDHIRVVKTAMQSAELDEVLIAPNMNSIEKPNASDPKHRIAMTVLRVKKEPGLNVYTGDSASLVDKFGRDPFLERIGQIYGTKKLYQVIGQDSFEKLVEQGKITADSNRLYLVSPRQGTGGALVIPEHLKEVATPLPGYPLPPLSSTEIRKKIQNNTRPLESELDPAVYEYIQRHHLYKE